jgi:hypothetical protein
LQGKARLLIEPRLAAPLNTYRNAIARYKGPPEARGFSLEAVEFEVEDQPLRQFALFDECLDLYDTLRERNKYVNIR